MRRRVKVRAGDTRPLEILVGATRLEDLSGLANAHAFFWRQGEDVLHVNGASVSVVDSVGKVLRLDPRGAAVGGDDAFQEPGVYQGYIRIQWSDDTETRHPGDAQEDLLIQVAPQRG